MAIETPSPAWPFRLNSTGSSMVFEEQDSDAEIAQCVRFVLSTEPGTLVGSPKLGLRDPSFKENGITLAELQTVLGKWEPRANITFTDDEIVHLAQTVGIEVSR
jgi:phage baseplate assembly protein W